MDKYVRNDDANDDLGVYNHKDDFQSISKRPVRNTYVRGHSNTDGEFKDRMDTAKAKLSLQEQKMMDLILEGVSIREAGKKLGISQQMASKYWQRIKQKLKDDNEAL